MISPRASSLTAAETGVAVETTPPPRPHSSIGSVTARTRTVRPSPLASTMCTETVYADGGSASLALRATSSSEASVSSRSASSSSALRPSRKLASPQPKLGKVSISECMV